MVNKNGDGIAYRSLQFDMVPLDRFEKYQNESQIINKRNLRVSWGLNRQPFLLYGVFGVIWKAGQNGCNFMCSREWKASGDCF